jgi:hypothetical protein
VRTLTELLAAADALPREDQRKLLRHLAAKLSQASQPRKATGMT